MMGDTRTSRPPASGQVQRGERMRDAHKAERKRDKMRDSIIDMLFVVWEHCTLKNLVPIACYLMLVAGVLAICRYTDFDLWKFLIKKRYRNTIYMWSIHVFIGIVTCKYYYNRRVRDVLKKWILKCIILRHHRQQRLKNNSASSPHADASRTCRPSSPSSSRRSSETSSPAPSSPSKDGVELAEFVRTNFFAAAGVYALVFVAHGLSLAFLFFLTFTLVPAFTLVEFLARDFAWRLLVRPLVRLGAAALRRLCGRGSENQTRNSATASASPEPTSESVADEHGVAAGGSDEKPVVEQFPSSVKSIWMTEENRRLLRSKYPEQDLQGIESSARGHRKLKILLVCEYAPCEFHGMAVRLKNLVRELSQQHEVRILTSRNKEQLQAEGFNDIATIDLYREMGYCLQNMWNPGNKLWVAPNLNLVENFFDFQPDVVHVFYPCIVGLPIFFLSYLLDVPVYCSHHVDMTYYVGKYWKTTLCRRMCYFWYSLNARVPAYLFADINTAPTRNALDKEFEIIYSNWLVQKLVRMADSFGGFKFPEESSIWSDESECRGKKVAAGAGGRGEQVDVDELYQHPTTSSRSPSSSCGHSPRGPAMLFCNDEAGVPVVEQERDIVDMSQLKDSPCTTASHRSEVGSDCDIEAEQEDMLSSPTPSPCSSTGSMVGEEALAQAQRPSTAAATSSSTSSEENEKPRGPLCSSSSASNSKKPASPDYLRKYMLKRLQADQMDPNDLKQEVVVEDSYRGLKKSASGSWSTGSEFEDRMTASTYSGFSGMDADTDEVMSLTSSISRSSISRNLEQRGPASFNFSEYVIPTSVGSTFCSDSERPRALKDNLFRQKIAIHESAKIILMVQRLAPEKRVEMALRQMPKLVGKYHLIVVGDGPAYGSCTSLTKSLYDQTDDSAFVHRNLFGDSESTSAEGSDELGGACSATMITKEQAPATEALSSNLNVSFTGMIPNEMLPTLYQNADFFLSCAVSETFGITVIEALSCNLVPLLARCQVFEELYERSPFITSCMFGTGEELLQTLLRLHSERIPTGEELRFQLRDSIFFTWDQAGKALLSQYRQIQKVRQAFA
mmetsp:Transcript_18313/g.45739  ORF Transcript_18313/g.45739 Transcript_18313/m.45739 type:complete len:1072 (-) Transcript_18313:1868-5083(-)